VPLLIIAAAVIVLLVLMTRFRMNGFVAILLVALGVGVAQGLSPSQTYESMVDGIGGQLSELVLILGLGAMFGRVLADSGAAQQIATTITDRAGIGRVQLAMMLTATLIGITMFYEVGFVLLIPLVFTIVRRYDLPLLWVGLPMSMTLSTMHSFLPPHPGPATVATTLGASQGVTLLYGLIIAVPAAAVLAYSWPRMPFVRRITPSIPEGLVGVKDYPAAQLPGLGRCLAIVLAPVLLMACSAVAELWLPADDTLTHVLEFIGHAPIALAIAFLLGVALLGSLETPTPAAISTVPESVPVAAGGAGAVDEAAPMAGASAGAGATADPTAAQPPVIVRPFADRDRWAGYQAAMGASADAVKPMAMILMIIGAGGAFKQVLVDSGVADYITDVTAGWNVSPIVLAWLIAVLLRISLGSATVTVVTASGIVLPLLAGSGVSPEIMTLAVTCGSICASHVNDPGFWLFKEYFNLSVVETLKVRTSYTTMLSLIGLGGVLLLHAVGA